MPRVVDCTLCSKVNTLPVTNSSGLVFDQVVISQEVWADVRILFTEEDLAHFQPGPTTNPFAEIERKIKAAFESDAVRNALVSEVRRGRLIGGEV